jgi:hypothetical protein
MLAVVKTGKQGVSLTNHSGQTWPTYSIGVYRQARTGTVIPRPITSLSTGIGTVPVLVPVPTCATVPVYDRIVHFDYCYRFYLKSLIFFE